MKLTLAAAVFLGCAAATAVAQKPSSAFDRGHGQQAWQNSGYAAVAAKCKTPPKAPSIGGGAATRPARPSPAPALPRPGRDPRRDRCGTKLEGGVGVGRQQRRRPDRRRRRLDPVREQRRGQRHEARPGHGPRDRAVRQDEYRRRAVAEQERRAVPRRARLGRRHRAARAATQDVREHVPGRAVRMRRRRRERPHGRRARRRIPRGERLRRVSTRTRRACSRSTATCLEPTASS